MEELGFTDPASQAMDGLAADSSSSFSISCDQTPAKNGNDMEDPIIIAAEIETPEKRLERPLPIMGAIKSLAERLGTTEEQSWAEIKSKAFYGRLSLSGIDEKGRLCGLERHWIPYIVPWGTDDTPPGCGSLSAGGARPEEPQHPSTSDIPKAGGFIAFDRVRSGIGVRTSAMDEHCALSHRRGCEMLWQTVQNSMIYGRALNASSKASIGHWGTPCRG